MKEFQLQFFGGLALTLGDRDLTRPLSVKARGLVCYLAITGRPQTRLKLAGMFWGEKPEADALRSLRVDLTKIRKHLAPYIEANRQTIAFKNNSSYWIDTETFEHHLRLVQSADGAAARTYLREAVQLYTGDFLEGYEAGDAYDFEEWVAAQRESYQAQVLAALDKLIEIHTELGEYEAAVECGNQILHIDPWREETHRSLMWLYVQNGQRGAALRQFETCRSVLEKEVGVEPERATIQLWQQIKEQEGVETAVTQPLPLPQTTPIGEIPFQAPSLVPFFSGRDEELRQLLAKVEASDGVKVLCLAGMGGVGKTSLAVQFAHHYQTHFPDGVLWANAASDPAAIAEKWAEAYGYDFRGIGRVEDRLAAVRTLLAEKQALIVVDNVEVAARVKPLLPEAGASTILLTVRNADLAHTLGADLMNLDVLSLENGRSLLAGIIGTTRIEGEQTVADEICQTLQNLPLALAIAGQYLVARPRRQLSDFLRRLKASKLLDVADSEGAVRASFEISWTALDLVQQKVFALLSVFEGRAFTAVAMAHIADLDFWVMQDHLDTLSARSLLIEQGSDYYRQHALLAHFADEKLPDKWPPYLKMVDYYSHFTDKHATDYQKLGEEWDNLDAVIQLTANKGLWQTLFRVNQNLHQAWFAQGLFSSAQKAYQLAHNGALDMEDEAYLGENLFRQGQAAVELGQLDEAQLFFKQATAIFEKAGDMISVSDIQYELARIYIDQARYEEAKQILLASLQVKDVLHDQRGIAQVKYRYSRLIYYLGDYRLAAKFALEAVTMQENLGEIADLIRTLRMLVWIHSYLEEYQQAQACGERALALAHQINDRGEIAMALYCLAQAEQKNENYDKALNLVGESLVLLEQMGDIHAQGLALLLTAVTYRIMGYCEEGVDFCQKAYAMSAQVQDKHTMLWSLGNMGMVYADWNNAQKARHYYLESKKMAQEVGDNAWVKRMDSCLAELKV
ncbi:MAG: tetratricopeptide repeat protein [Anaerolineae bacterium]|nr:tetratricopeptide repeat protein [Anaerolineae bacterium]